MAGAVTGKVNVKLSPGFTAIGSGTGVARHVVLFAGFCAASTWVELAGQRVLPVFCIRTETVKLFPAVICVGMVCEVIAALSTGGTNRKRAVKVVFNSGVARS